MNSNIFEDISDLRTFSKGEYIYNCHTFDGFTYYLTDGLVALSLLNVEGMEKTLIVIRPGNIFGENSFGDKPHFYTAKALTDSKIWRFNKDSWLEAVRKDPIMALATVNSLSKRIRFLNYEIIQMSFSDAIVRLAYVLYSLFNQSEMKTKNGCLYINVSQEELAKMAGLCRVTINKSINFFKNEGIIETKGRCLTLINMQKLNDIIVDNP
ncbi:MAG: Crp/Fnr family transcriptional regulator [Thermincola sp.]|jgi:CRP-like cAMP-binding protein|nr:Crp/Fnr family transcriptional regulator [Thermincola sp.]